MQIKPYILLADKKTAIYEPNRMYSQQDVYGVVFSDISGEYIRVLSTKEFKGHPLLESGVKISGINKFIFK